jgi:hypothetical protein
MDDATRVAIEKRAWEILRDAGLTKRLIAIDPGSKDNVECWKATYTRCPCLNQPF